ncbi:MAG: ATP-binding cassette domain-containing protein [Microbacterium sp.]|uniref:ATP-binding cassette domain-containing protein n=1 Tax=Microbacterium sp. TaxID=51671 RepID=UPI00282863EF|nr:ATP-binding cassette domain-containing protein [Microbacterium sp.]MDR2323470.1 ATP-binding cassette domain-containing protein [Microbacterium sp.]
MTDGQVFEFSHATKRFGVLTAVDDLSARIEPGAVTAFLGPNGAGKTTSLRMLLGQIRPTSGTATIGGVSYAELRHPLRTVGSVLEEAVYRPRRTAPRQLSIAAKANGIPLSRVDEVLALVGLQNEAETRIGAYSLGMRQRLSVAGALLGDPGALVLDEPANGLDPEGIRWMRLLMRRLADEGRTVLVSSHVLSEIEQIADNVLVLSKGRLVYADSIGKLSDPTTGSVVVDADDRAALATALQNAGLTFDVLRSGLTVHNTDAAAVGAVAASAGLALTTLLQRGPSLEEVFLDLVHGRRDPLTGAIPVVGAPVPASEEPAAAEAAEAEPGEGADASAAAAESEAADGAAEGEPADAEHVPTAGLFGAAAAVPVVAAASAGVAGLFGTAAEAAPAEGTVAIPTTRREAAEFAAAQSAAGEDEDATDDGSGSAGGDVPAADEAEGAEADAADAAEGEGEDEDAAEGADAAGGEHAAAAEDGAESAESSEDSDSDSDSDEDAAAEDGSAAEDAEPEQSAAEAPADAERADEAGSTADEAEAGAESDDAAEPAEAEEAHDEGAIAAGVALTAPIVADYTPGEPHPEGAEDSAGTVDEQDAPLTHAAESQTDEDGAALGSFETAALTIPEAAPVSFDDLITGVPSAAPSSDEANDVATDDRSDVADEGAEHGDVDDAPTAATTIITTPAAEGEFATPEPSTETTEIAGIEIFAALADGRTQEIQVILDETPDEDDDLEDVTQGEIHQDDDPRAAAVSASLAAAARAFFTDDAPTYTPGPSEESGDQPGEPSPSEEQHDDQAPHEQGQDGEHREGDQHEEHHGH